MNLRKANVAWMRRLLVLAALLGLLSIVAPSVAGAAPTKKPESYSALLAQVGGGQVTKVVLMPKKMRLRARLSNGQRYVVTYTAAQKRQLLTALHRHNVRVVYAKKKHRTRIRRRYIALAVLGVVALASAWWFLGRRRRTVERDPRAA